MTIPTWPLDDPYLKEHYGVLPLKEIAEQLGRTVQAVKARAHRLGLKIRPEWPDDQRAFLRKHYDEFTCAELGKMLGHTAEAVKRRAHKEGITKDIRIWEPHEVDFLEANYNRMTAAEMGEILGMTDRQVWTKASALGIRKCSLLSPEATELMWNMRDVEDVVGFFSREFGVGRPALERLLEEMEKTGGPPEL